MTFTGAAFGGAAFGGSGESALPEGHGVGSVTGTSTAAAVGSSTAAAAGSSAGTSTAAAVGTTATADGAGSSTGTSTAAAVGTGIVSAAGSSVGTSTSSAVGVRYYTYTQTYEQGFRVADDALALYELYVGEDEAPDFSSSPAETSASLPFTHTPTPPLSGTKVLHCVVRQRNAYDLVGFNAYETLLEIDAAGDAVLGPLTAPLDLALYDGATAGSAKVLATYLQDDDSSPADSYEVYAKEGSDPVPGTDVPAATGTLVFLGQQAVIDVTVTGFSAGATLHVIATAKRASDSERASTAAATIALAESLDLVDAQAFGGAAYEQR